MTTLNDSGAGSLRDAMVQANVSAGADTVLFQASGTITLASALPAIQQDVMIDADGTIDIDAGVRTPFVIHAGVTVTLRGITIREALGPAISNAGTLNLSRVVMRNNRNSGSLSRGTAVDNSGTLTIADSEFTRNDAESGAGGALANSGGTVLIERSLFDNNWARYNFGHGGAIYSQGGTLTIIDSAFTRNIAEIDGGAIDLQSTRLTVRNSRFEANKANFASPGNSGNNGQYGDGGAIKGYCPGGLLMDITHTQFIDNQARNGGAVQTVDCNIEIDNSVFQSNIARNTAGHATMGGAISTTRNLVVSGSSFIDNSAGNLSAAILAGVTVITNSTFARNRGDGNGSAAGAVAADNVTITNSSFVSNSPSGGSATIAPLSSGTTSLILHNVLMVSGSSAANCASSVIADASSMSTDGSCTGASQITSSQLRLGGLANNGGSTQTHALLPGSVAIDAGNNSQCPALDQRGVARPQGAHCDVGAFEYRDVLFADGFDA